MFYYVAIIIIQTQLNDIKTPGTRRRRYLFNTHGIGPSKITSFARSIREFGRTEFALLGESHITEPMEIVQTCEKLESNLEKQGNR